MQKGIKLIATHKALREQQNGNGIIVDVREPAEYRDGHLPNTVNIPSTQFKVAAFESLQPQKIFLVCQSGRRASNVAKKLNEAGFEEIYVLDRHMEQIATQSTHDGWSIDQQFRFILGILIAIYLIGFHWISVWFTLIPIIIVAGLIFSAITDICYLRMGIAMMPWNQEKKIPTLETINPILVTC